MQNAPSQTAERRAGCCPLLSPLPLAPQPLFLDWECSAGREIDFTLLPTPNRNRGDSSLRCGQTVRGSRDLAMMSFLFFWTFCAPGRDITEGAISNHQMIAGSPKLPNYCGLLIIIFASILKLIL